MKLTVVKELINLNNNINDYFLCLIITTIKLEKEKRLNIIFAIERENKRNDKCIKVS